MYKSPITIIESTIDSIYEDIVKKRDDAIFAEIQTSFGVDLDREELIRALQYDRNQYEKGYLDGKTDAMAELVRCKDCEYFTEHNDFRTGRHLGYGECHRFSGELFLRMKISVPTEKGERENE